MEDVSLMKNFESLVDPRVERTKKYPLEEILLLIISAAISGCAGWKSIKDFGELKLEWLKKFFPYDNGIPADDTIARIVRRLCPKSFKACFLQWTNSICNKTAGDIISIDGKTVRGSHDNNRTLSPIHMVSAWSDANSIVLGQEKVTTKSNEITAIPSLLEMLDIKGCIITIDAMGCQKSITDKICNQGADYLLSLKGNQGNLHEDVKEFFKDAINSDFSFIDSTYDKDIDYGHGRIETRECWAVNINQYKKNFRNIIDWKNLETIIMIKSTRELKTKKTTETRFYISSCPCDAKHLNNVVRKHWSIESMHWILDVTFREDESRIRKGDGPENMAILRHISLNVMKKYTKIKESIPGKIRRAAFSDVFRSGVLKEVLKISEN
jgi:predicted transposase YbfD/YdcC